ncbi:MAG: hypothetical protein A2076_02900 [Geobacteraceae bacterium GWC2_53_11]|nr:MAG: hypothetical protein A2076_02900 [Geobacteraceae bacterium GWC2_53_11]
MHRLQCFPRLALKQLLLRWNDMLLNKYRYRDQQYAWLPVRQCKNWQPQPYYWCGLHHHWYRRLLLYDIDYMLLKLKPYACYGFLSQEPYQFR